MAITSRLKRIRKRPIEAIIFDYDGVIGKTDSRQFEWFKHWAQFKNKPFKYTNTKDFMEFYKVTMDAQPEGTAWEDAVQKVYNALDLPCNMRDSSHEVWPHYEQYKLDNPAELYEGIEDTIKELWRISALRPDSMINKRTRFGINTSNTWESIGNELEKAELLPYFDLRITREVLDMYHGAGGSIIKPSKISVALALAHLNSRVPHTMHIGDSLQDLRASVQVNNGLSFKPESLIMIGAAWGYEGREYLEQGIQTPDGKTYHFDEIADDHSEIVPIYKKYMKVA